MERKPAPEMPDWLAAELPFERYSVSVDGMAMHVMEQGEGRDVLLVHGNPTWGFLYRRIALALKDAPLRLIMPDLIGLGLSHKPRRVDAHTLERQAAWLGELVEGLDLRDVILVVQDWGGPIGTLSMAQRAEQLAGMVVMNTVLAEPREGFRPTAFHKFSRLPLVSTLAFRGLAFPQRALAKAQGDPASISGLVSRAYRYPLRGWRNNAAPLAMARMVPDTLTHASVPALRSCRALVEEFQRRGGPAEIIWGERDPVLGRALKRTSSLLPDAPVTRTEAGHFVQEEVPELVAAAILRVAGLLD